jgi:hypothetical protein
MEPAQFEFSFAVVETNVIERRCYVAMFARVIHFLVRDVMDRRLLRHDKTPNGDQDDQLYAHDGEYSVHLPLRVS